MCHIKIHSKIITIFLSLKIKISDHLRRKTMEPKDRIRLIYEKELKMSQRSFAKSIGIAPTGLSGIFRSGVRVTRLIALNSNTDIEPIGSLRAKIQKW